MCSTSGSFRSTVVPLMIRAEDEQYAEIKLALRAPSEESDSFSNIYVGVAVGVGVACVGASCVAMVCVSLAPRGMGAQLRIACGHKWWTWER
jgi:hypothetical protein